MARKSLAEWMQWQEGLNPHEIDLGLGRVRDVAARLTLTPPPGKVIAVAGTNGKGSVVGLTENLLAANGLKTCVYTSPHLVNYHERIRIAGIAIDDESLIQACEAVEAVRGDTALTFFEFGTLAALQAFSNFGGDVWILEVGLGGRLDAVNVIDPDISLITTVALDHQSWLGDTVEAIAHEKAGIMRPGRPAFFGDRPVPNSLRAYAKELGAILHCYGTDFRYLVGEQSSWGWRGADVELTGLSGIDATDDAQLKNASLALAAVESCDPALLSTEAVRAALSADRPAGRFQIFARDPEWVLDVAHNPQAAGVFRERLAHLPQASRTTMVIGMLADKQGGAFIQELKGVADDWIACTIDGPRGRSGADLVNEIEQMTGQSAELADTPAAGFRKALELTGCGGRILVCGSFRMVGPALSWLDENDA
jgi:dihydrofolate synthase/folylpolyglutamate synthase